MTVQKTFGLFLHTFIIVNTFIPSYAAIHFANKNFLTKEVNFWSLLFILIQLSFCSMVKF